MSDTFNPWLSLWTQPRAAVRKLVDTDPTYMVIVLALVAGAITGLQTSTEGIISGQSIDYPMARKIGGVIGGSIGGIAALYLLGWLYSVVSQWLGGNAPARNLRTASAWGSVPSIVSGIMILICYSFVTKSNMVMIAVLVWSIALFFTIWQIVILCKMIGEVNEFSAWKGFGVLIITLLLVVSVVFIVVIALGLLAGIVSLVI